MINLFQKIVDLENDGINVTIGSNAGGIWQKKKYAIRLFWNSPHHWTSGMPSGCMGEEVEFEDYKEFPHLFEEIIVKFKAEINNFLKGSAI